MLLLGDFMSKKKPKKQLRKTVKVQKTPNGDLFIDLGLDLKGVAYYSWEAGEGFAILHLYDENGTEIKINKYGRKS